jgi:hypothetical protein
VWKDIGMPSGHAYAKALRTVKTCVGSEWCRMGTQDSTQMGKDLERAMWRMYAPHKVKFAVSGCPRNCAEAGIKDVGIIGVDSGWEMYVAGNGGIKTEVAHFFTKLKTAEEVLEYTGAFMQLYREEGWYLERTVHYVNRVGLDYVKKKILDDHEGRKALWERCSSRWTASPTPGSSSRSRAAAQRTRRPPHASKKSCNWPTGNGCFLTPRCSACKTPLARQARHRGVCDQRKPAERDGPGDRPVRRRQGLTQKTSSKKRDFTAFIHSTFSYIK